MSLPAAIEFAGIEKAFFGVPVLNNVSFSVSAGRTLALVGENGAGKSTLMNILGGNLMPDSGVMRIRGMPYTPAHPTDAAAAQVAFVHQELNLFSNLSIAENLYLKTLPRLGPSPFVDRSRLRRSTAALLAQVGLSVGPDTRIEELSAGERQLVEIARALALEPRLIIFDEPTTSLSARETDMLFALMRGLRARGVAMIYISHVLEHVLQQCDDIVVLRDGQVVAQGPVAEFTTSSLVTAMVGRSLERLYPERRGHSQTEAALVARQVSQPYVVRDISFTLHRGEVLGLSGLMGAGRSELARILFGLDPHAEGEITLGGATLASSGPRRRIERGLAFLTEDRRHEGLCLDASIADNTALVSLRQHARSPLRLLDRSSWRNAIDSVLKAVRLTAKGETTQPVKTLSGGNQQKVVVAKWLETDPDFVVLDEPTKGIDVGARVNIYEIIHGVAARGKGVLVVSSEAEELLSLCHRILVMRNAQVVGEFDPEQADTDDLIRTALTHVD